MGGLEAGRALDLARASGDVETVLAVASGFRQAGELEKALALLDRAVELAPKLASALLNRGAVRQAMGRLAEAAADYEAASALDPALPEARFNLGVLAEERSQYVAALGEAGRLAHRASQARNYEAFIDISNTLNEACANCHKVYRDKGGTEGSGTGRCQ